MVNDPDKLVADTLPPEILPVAVTVVNAPVLANVIVGEVVVLPVQTILALLTVKLAPELKLVALAFPVVVKLAAFTVCVELVNDELTVKEGDKVQIQVYRETELGYVVIVNKIHQGLVYKNEVFKHLRIGEWIDEAFVKKIENLIPLKRMAKKDEYRGAIQFLCSDASSYMTGQNLIIDGGRSVW